MIKLNLGSSLWLHAGYVNVDKYYTLEFIKNHPQARIEEGAEYVQADILTLPFSDNYADEVELHQVIEHFSIDEVIAALKEIHRVMKPGAILNISAPSFNGLCANWVKKELQRVSFDFTEFSYLAQEFYGCQAADGEFHKCPITRDFLGYALGQAGFKEGNFWLFEAGSRMPEEGFGLMMPVHLPNDERAFFRNETIFARATK